MLIMISVYYMIAVLAVIIALNNMKIVSKLTCKLTRNTVIIMMVLVIIKYIGYGLFGIGLDRQALEVFKRSQLFTSMALVIPMAFTVRHLYKKTKIGTTQFMILLTPLMLFYVWFIIKSNLYVVPSLFLGYTTELSDSWKIHLSIIQGVVTIGFFYYILRGMIMNKDINARVRLLFMTVPFFLFTLDGIAQLMDIPFFQPLTISEILALLSIGYGFSYRR